MKTDESTILELEERRYRAMLAGDVVALDELCSGDLLYTHSRGDRDDKSSYLAKVASGHFVYHEIDHPADRILIAGDAALVFGRMTAKVTAEGQDLMLDNRCLAVWLRGEDGWRFAAYQPTPLPRA